MNTNQPRHFAVEKEGDVLIFSAWGSVGTLAEDEAREEWEGLLDTIDQSGTTHAVIDLAELDYFGSIMLYLMVRLWKRVSARDGKLAICNASKVGKEILTTAKFDSMWPIVSSRQEALQAVRS